MVPRSTLPIVYKTPLPYTIITSIMIYIIPILIYLYINRYAAYIIATAHKTTA